SRRVSQPASSRPMTPAAQTMPPTRAMGMPSPGFRRSCEQRGEGYSHPGPPPQAQPEGARPGLGVPRRGGRGRIAGSPAPPGEAVRMPVAPAVFAKAQRHLARGDPVLKRLVRLVGPCTLWFEPDGFAALVRCVIAQQLSTRAARTIHDRLA